MRTIFYSFLLLFSANITAQNTEVISWLNTNAVIIEDANPDTHLISFSNNEPQKFSDARLFGFGEATHHGKEFFNLKAKFFKYLVEHHNVRLFIMEESYQAEQGINEWISGGKGDKSTIVKNFRHYLWYTQEVADLLEWMRNFNIGKPNEEQIRFYGIDNQMGDDINEKLRNYITKYNLVVNDDLLAAVDSCSTAEQGKVKYKEWNEKMAPKLQQVKQVLKQNEEHLITANEAEYIDMMRAFSYLEDYTAYISWPNFGVRDNAMYENVLKILKIEGNDSKAFIWAHNEHINKKDLANMAPSLGSRLKEHFGDAYYALGFDFGSGTMKGYIIKKNEVKGIEYRKLEKPYKKTYAETLFLAEPSIYFVDIKKAIENPVMEKFFNTKMKQLFIGGPGFDPKDKIFYSRKYKDTYDGIIFIKNISPSIPQKVN